jgi:tetraacyldisaccharide 4'-kinase
MREPAFWWRPEGFGAHLLAPAAAIYGAFAARAMGRPGRRGPVPVICIGNLTHGGAGKTPTAIAVAQMLQRAGHHPFFLTRGYGGRVAGPARVDTAAHIAADVGDEPLLLARVAPTIVARDRPAGAEAAAAAGASVVVMDDGFQNPSLVKDLAIVVLDGRRGIGNGRVVPAGPLRAPLDAQLARAGALLIVGPESEAAHAPAKSCAARGLPLLRARLEPDAAAVARLRARSHLAFAGIADPQKFFATLAEAGIDAPVTVGFPDHHAYSAAEAATLCARAEKLGLSLLTTEKDLARISGNHALSELARRASALPVHLVFADDETMRKLVTAAAGPPRGT